MPLINDPEVRIKDQEELADKIDWFLHRHGHTISMRMSEDLRKMWGWLRWQYRGDSL